MKKGAMLKQARLAKFPRWTSTLGSEGPRTCFQDGHFCISHRAKYFMVISSDVVLDISVLLVSSFHGDDRS
ncbi:hypothetical protein QJS04_geneDACA010407 [Acorus gramineus]|uniref:Uncharacterized protein n=1 Tax=Acorus gramineus TaxID=55184 RepID=A0AAV9A643_ACOGR|nr:hypothetical protein QJS04_geneDACA010407 [Acorus gramineus]